MTSLLHVALLALVLAALSACTASEQDTPEYKAACEGAPLATVERREAAMEQGFNIDRRYDCIDKASYADVSAQQAAWTAAHPEQAHVFHKAGKPSVR